MLDIFSEPLVHYSDEVQLLTHRGPSIPYSMVAGRSSCRPKDTITKVLPVSGLPAAPQDCRVGREGNESLEVVCLKGWSGGLPQTFHLGEY